MQTEPFIERILETENLTDALDDAQASQLLNWGTSQASIVLSGLNSEEEAGNKINALMAVMRKINRMLAGYQRKPREEWCADFVFLNARFIETFGSSQNPDFEFNNPEFDSIFTRLPSLPAQQVLAYLLRWPHWLQTAP